MALTMVFMLLVFFDTTQGPVAVDPEYGDDNTTGAYDFDWWYRIITY